VWFSNITPMILHHDLLDSTYLAFAVTVSPTLLGVPIVIIHPQSSLSELSPLRVIVQPTPRTSVSTGAAQSVGVVTHLE